MLTEKECRNALSDLKNQLEDILGEESENVESVNVLNQLMDEHFENPPITVSDIPYEKELICWDNAEKEWCSIYSEGGEVSIAYFQLPTVYTMYETFDKKHGNRFYRKEVQECN